MNVTNEEWERMMELFPKGFRVSCIPESTQPPTPKWTWGFSPLMRNGAVQRNFWSHSLRSAMYDARAWKAGV